MSKKEKLLKRLESKPKDFTWKDLVSLMAQHGYEIVERKNKGSKRTFYNKDINRIAHFHEPHPRKVLKQYQIENALEVLR